MTKIPLTPRAVEMLKEQFERFEKRFGRNPLPGESLFFDPSSSGDAPKPFDPGSIMKLMLDGLRASGADEALLYAAEKTGRFLTEKTYAASPRHIRDEWDAAVAEYNRRQSASDD